MTDAGHIVVVTDFSTETLRSIIAHLEVSSEFEHMVYREAELDAIRSGGGEIVTIGPDEEASSVMGLNLMDGSRLLEAAEAGLRQGKSEADSLREFWRT